jgi:hypothetical protein
MAEKVIIEDEGNAGLDKRIAELEEANARLEASTAEMHLTVSRSNEVMTVLRRELDVELKNYELLRLGNTRLLNERNEARSQVTVIWSQNWRRQRPALLRTPPRWRQGLQ